MKLALIILGQLLTPDASVSTPVVSAAPSGKPVNMLAGAQMKVDRATNAERMTDGQAADPGDNWQSVLTSVVEKEGSVTWDFGYPREFQGAWIQADNNDVYVLSTSDDGVNFTTAWESSTVDNAGMQTRTATELHGRGRWVKLTAKGGDGMFSVSEVAVFANGADAKAFTPGYVRNPSNPPPQPFDLNWVVIAVVLVGIVYLVRGMKPPEATEPAAAEAKKDEPPPPEAKT